MNHDPFAAVRERNYRLFIGGWLPASIGLQMQGLALAWEIWERTHDALALGMIGLARALPTVLLALPAGRIVDLVDRKRVLVLTQLGFALSSGLLMLGSMAWERGLLGRPVVALWVMYLLVCLTGCARVFNGPSRSSLLPQMFREGAIGPVFHNAITWNSGVFQLAATAGPLLAGLLIAWTGQAWPVYAVTAIASLWFGMTAMLIQPYQRDGVHEKVSSIVRLLDPSVILPGMLEGVRHMWREKRVLGAITLDLFAVLLGGATALMPVYADILGVGAVGLGALRAAPFVGALLMAVALAHRPPFERAGATLLWSVAIFGLCTVAFGLSRNFFLSLALLGVAGAVDNVSVVIRHVLVIAHTPDHLRGRVAAVNSVFIECSNELGAFESGLVARLVNPVFSVVSGGIGTVLVVIATALLIPQLREMQRADKPAS
jgi:MFS family permease